MKRTPLRRRTPLRPSGDRRARRPNGKALSWNKTRVRCKDRADGRCEARVAPGCPGVGQQAHHIVLRSRGGSDDLSNLMWLCHLCHAHIHANPAEATARGWMRSREAS